MPRHPLHPALVHFPIACWMLAVCFDIAGFWLGEKAWDWSAGLLVIGCSMAFLAMLVGLMDLARVTEARALKDAYWHMGLMTTAFTVFALRLFLGLDPSFPGLSLLLDICGLVFLIAGGWYGGKLVYQHGVGLSD